MAFRIQNWGRVSTSMNEPIVTLADATVSGSPSTYSYYSADTQATMSASAYFNSVIYDLSVGDLIQAYSSTDLTTVSYLVTSVTTNVAVSRQTPVLTKSGTLTSAQLLGAYATPVLAIAAPGANRIILVKSCTIEVVFLTAAYANGGAFAPQYTNTANGAGTLASATIAAAAINGVAATSSLITVAGALAITAAASVVNQGIYFSNQTGAFITGAGAVNYQLDYSIMTTTS